MNSISIISQLHIDFLNTKRVIMLALFSVAEKKLATLVIERSGENSFFSVISGSFDAETDSCLNDCVIREVQEELDIAIDPYNLISTGHSFKAITPKGSFIEVDVFCSVIANGLKIKPNVNEIANYWWMGIDEAFSTLTFPEAKRALWVSLPYIENDKYRI